MKRTSREPSSTGTAAAGRKALFSIKPGGIAGYLVRRSVADRADRAQSSLTGSASYVDIVAKGEVYVGWLSHSALERVMDRRPNVLLTLAKRLVGLLSPLILHIDSALEWQHSPSSEDSAHPSDSASRRRRGHLPRGRRQRLVLHRRAGPAARDQREAVRRRRCPGRVRPGRQRRRGRVHHRSQARGHRPCDTRHRARADADGALQCHRHSAPCDHRAGASSRPDRADRRR